MTWNIPGTTIFINKTDAEFVEQQFCSMFFGGGMVLSQVCAVTGLEPYTVQNWVKRELLPPPENKRYNLNQLCRIITINMLKNVLAMEKIISLISFVNGALDDESDDMIDDAKLYFLFVRLASRVDDGVAPEKWEDLIADSLLEYQEPVPGARQRVQKVLSVMLVARAASQLQKQAEQMLTDL